MSHPVKTSSGDMRADIARLARVSVDLIGSTQSGSGAYPAAIGFAPYGFCWFRDGAFIAEGMSVARADDSARAFHGWCAGVLRRESAAVDQVVRRLDDGDQPTDAELLPARYTLAGHRHDDDWWNYQVDGYGTWLWALRRHLDRSGDDPPPYAEAVAIAVRYLLAVGDRPCRDWWEEHRDRVHVSTLASVYAGLRAAVEIGLPATLTERAIEKADAVARLVSTEGVHQGALRKWLGGTDVDASLVVAGAPFGLFPPGGPVMAATVERIEAELTTTGGGVHRYPGDTFYGGGQWPILAAFLGLHHVVAGNRQRALDLLAWITGTADGNGHLPEQVAPLQHPDRLAEWDSRWGRSARPLLWSHGMLLALAGELDLLRT